MEQNPCTKIQSMCFAARCLLVVLALTCWGGLYNQETALLVTPKLVLGFILFPFIQLLLHLLIR